MSNKSSKKKVKAVKGNPKGVTTMIDSMKPSKKKGSK